MRTLFTMLLMAGMITNGFSQVVYKTIITPQNKSVSDTVIQRYQDELRKKQVPDFGMPNAIKVKPQPDIYQGNNGQGFDIYVSPIDNMSILKPDNSNRSNMPVVKYETLQKIIPMQGFSTTDSSGPVKWRTWKNDKDSITPKPWEPNTRNFPKK